MIAIKGFLLCTAWCLNLMLLSMRVPALQVGYEFADLGSGVYHWSMDNYGSKNTPIFGTQIEAFQVCATDEAGQMKYLPIK